MRPILDAQKPGAPSGEGLGRDLAQVVSEAIFDIARLMEAALHLVLSICAGPGTPCPYGKRVKFKTPALCFAKDGPSVKPNAKAGATRPRIR
jgi:hypothetical protein